MFRRSIVGVMGWLTVACGGATQYPAVGGVVTEARADQMAFASKYQQKGLAFRGSVQKKGIKPSTATGFDFSAYGMGGNVVVGNGKTRRMNVNYGYVFVGEGSDETKRALCLFEPEDLKQAAALTIGQPVTVTCLFSKFVGAEGNATPVFSGCSVLE